MHLNLARFCAADSAQFTHSHGPLTSRIIYRNLSKHVKTTCGFVNIAKKAEIARRKVFFSLNYKSFLIQTRFEQLSSSIRWRVIAISKRDVFQPRLGFGGAEIFTSFWCFVHNFGYRYARKLFKGSKEADFGLVSEKILSHNNGPIGWGPGPGKGS